MSLFLTDFDQWYDTYEAASPAQQHEMVLEAISQPIPIAYAKEIDLGMILIEVWEPLFSHNLIDAALTFVTTLQQQQPELYQQEFQYFDDMLVTYYLFQDDLTQVQSALERFKTHPVQGIDSLITVLKDLQFYQAKELVVDLCRQVYQPIATSHKLIGGSEVEFGTVVFSDLLEQAYHQHQQGVPVNWEELWAEVAQFDFKPTPEIQAEVIQNLTAGIEADSTFFATFETDRASLLPQLSLGFCRYMADQQQMSFICSQAIWSEILEFLEEHDRSKKPLTHPDRYFALDQNKLDRHVAQLVGGLLSPRQPNAFALLWGIPYLYEFLRSQHVIQDSVYQEALSIAANLKAQLINVLSRSLWQYDFVHRWQRPEGIPSDVFVAESERFKSSLEQVEPLSDQPIERLSLKKPFPSFVNPQVVQSLPASPKPSKPRKSFLEEVSDLPDTPKSSKSKQSGKKNKKKKGFQ
jgi:hypothetical protein